MVVKRGCSDQSVLPMAEHFRGRGHVLRFIEFMDSGTASGWRLDDVVAAAEIIAVIGERRPLEPLAPGYPGGRLHAGTVQRARSTERTPASSTRSARPQAGPRPGCCPPPPSMSPLRQQPSAAWCPGPGSGGRAAARQAAGGMGRPR